MEETLGKRIAAHRKQLGITQDRLAEQLGVTAQAVSKWENDQSCPDITTLPKLAEIFGISVDALLGIVPPQQSTVHEAEVVSEEDDREDTKHNWEVRWDAGRKGNVALSLWIILTASCMFATRYLHLDISLWDLLWTNGLIVFGLFRLFDKFRFFHLGCVLLGAYFLTDKLNILPFSFSSDLLMPTFLLLFGVSLLVDAMRKPIKPEFIIKHNSKISNHKTDKCSLGEDSFECDALFCSNHHTIDLPLLRKGDIEVRFGELTVDLSNCQEFANNCHIDTECTFAELTILIPRHIRANIDRDAAFGDVVVQGDCDREASNTIYIDADVRFGEITIRYV